MFLIQIVFHLRSRVSVHLQDVVALQTMQRFTKCAKMIYTRRVDPWEKKKELKYLVCESITIEYELQSLTILFSVRKVEKLSKLKISKGRKQMVCKGSLLEHLIVVSPMFG